MKGLTLSTREQSRIQVLNKMIGKEVPVADAAGADGCERAPCVATTGGVSRGGSCRHSTRKQRQATVDRHGCRGSGAGAGPGSRPLRRFQPLSSDRDAGRAGGHPPLALHRPASLVGGWGPQSPAPARAQALPAQGTLPPGGDAAADRWEPSRLAGGSGATPDPDRRRGRRHGNGSLRPVQGARGRAGLHADAQGGHRALRSAAGPLQRPA